MAAAISPQPIITTAQYHHGFSCKTMAVHNHDPLPMCIIQICRESHLLHPSCLTITASSAPSISHQPRPPRSSSTASPPKLLRAPKHHRRPAAVPQFLRCRTPRSPSLPSCTPPPSPHNRAAPAGFSVLCRAALIHEPVLSLHLSRQKLT
jgi:hypothetical protein